MKTKTIDLIIKKKIGEWAATIDDIDVRTLVLNNTIVTGGCITSMLLKEKVNDYDVYFKDQETTLAVAQYYVKKYCEKNKLTFAAYKYEDLETTSYFDENENKNKTTVKRPEVNVHVEAHNDRVKVYIKSAGVMGENQQDDYQYFESERDEAVIEDFVDNTFSTHQSSEDAADMAHEITGDDEKGKYRPVFMSENAITLSNKIQIVTRFFGNPEEIHTNYDFVHCTNYWQSSGNTMRERLNLKQEALECILAKELKYVGSLYPLCSIIRLRKFIKRGWTINAGQILKMCTQLSQLDLTRLDVLQEQLVGVDVAYFNEVLSLLSNKTDNNGRIDSAYLVELIDRMF